MQQNFQDSVERVQRQVAERLSSASEDLGKRMESLTQSTDKQLQEISGQVERRLTEGFEKTTETFHNVLTRLQLIDEAQKKITELSTNVVSLQEVLADRTSRGTFGEVQLHALVSNLMPEASYQMQYTLSNGKIVDCMLFLPEPTGKVADRLEVSAGKLPPHDLAGRSGRRAQGGGAQFRARRADARAGCRLEVHPAGRNLAGGACCSFRRKRFSPRFTRAIRNWWKRPTGRACMLASPTTLWAILTTAGAVLKDAATRQQVHIIQEHLTFLSRDFERFQERMEALAKHIRQAHEDVDQVHTSARKITSRFGKIERLELEGGAETSRPSRRCRSEATKRGRAAVGRRGRRRVSP